MPDHGAGFTKTESHTGAAQGDTYLNCETALNYETALLECASGSQSAVGKIYAREKDQLRAVAHRIVRDMSRAEDVIHEAFAQILRDAKNFDRCTRIRPGLDLRDRAQHGAQDAEKRQARTRVRGRHAERHLRAGTGLSEPRVLHPGQHGITEHARSAGAKAPREPAFGDHRRAHAPGDCRIPPGSDRNRQGVDPERTRGHAPAARMSGEYILRRCIHRRASATVGVTAW